MESLAPQRWWNEHNKSIEFQIAPPWDDGRKWIEQHVPKGHGKALEIGCYPGRYLATLGEMGYELNGVDLTPGTSTSMASWLKAEGYKIGSIFEQDYFICPLEADYDVVMSLGFLEHFKDWPAVLRRHVSHLRPGGLLLVCCPNFAGWVQHSLRRWLDPENLKRHNLDAMDPFEWIRAMEQEGIEVLWAGYLGVFDFHTEPQQRSLFQRIAVRCVELSRQFLRRHLKDNPAWSPYGGLVVKKN